MNPNGRWIVFARWDGKDGFQHYRNRDPIWIKNYVRLTSSDEYRSLTFSDRGLLHGLWLEYARSGRALRDDTSALGRRLGQRVLSEQLQRLNDAGFLAFSASKPIAERYHDASPEKNREEKEVEPPKSPADAGDFEPPTSSSRSKGTNPRAKTKHGKVYRAAESFVRNAGVQYTDTSYAEEMERFDLTQHERDLLNELRIQLRTQNGTQQLVPFNLILDTEPEDTE